MDLWDLEAKSHASSIPLFHWRYESLKIRTKPLSLYGNPSSFIGLSIVAIGTSESFSFIHPLRWRERQGSLSAAILLFSSSLQLLPLELLNLFLSSTHSGGGKDKAVKPNNPHIFFIFTIPFSDGFSHQILRQRFVLLNRPNLIFFLSFPLSTLLQVFFGGKKKDVHHSSPSPPSLLPHYTLPLGECRVTLPLGSSASIAISRSTQSTAAAVSVRDASGMFSIS